MAQPRLHEDEVDIDTSLARRLLAEQMPQYGELSLSRVPSGGTENAIFRLGDDLAVRMPVRLDAVGGLLKEVRWLSVLSISLGGGSVDPGQRRLDRPYRLDRRGSTHPGPIRC